MKPKPAFWSIDAPWDWSPLEKLYLRLSSR
jgi:hypothetical protein